MNPDWRKLLSNQLGPMPFGGILRRTEANGPMNAPITVLGVYPAAVQWQRLVHDGTAFNLPTEVEQYSFDPSSKSGSDLDKLYLKPLGLKRSQILALDLMPYFFANTAKDPKSHRSMWDNVVNYSTITGQSTAINRRPTEDELLQRCRSMPGNQSRLKEYVTRASARLLITLGRETAAYVRGYSTAIDGQRHLYSEPEELNLFGRLILTVHLVHPGNLQRAKSDKWRTEHDRWCKEFGRTFIASIPR